MLFSRPSAGKEHFMSRFFAAGLVAGALFIGAQTAQAIEIHDGPTGVTKNEADKTFKGYTLYNGLAI